MTSQPLLRRLQADDPHAPHVTIYLNDQPLRVPGQSNLAAVLMTHGLRSVRRNPAGGAARAPYCMMGACFECLVDVDGMPNTQSCLTTVRDGMRVLAVTQDATQSPEAR